MEKRFLLIEADVLPEVFLKVLRAKEMLADGTAKNVSAATKLADISRSAFYKYKDCIFDAENSKEVLTVSAVLRDETGALQSLLAGISAAGASIVTINQATPANGIAQVAVSVRTGGMQMTFDEMLMALRSQPAVVDVHRAV
ncbi:MAG: ACT domain-containing protein [Ruthenibacterium sp.]